MSDFANVAGSPTQVMATPTNEAEVEEVYVAHWISQNGTNVFNVNNLHGVTVNKAGLGGNSVQLFNGTVMTNNVIGVVDTTVSGTPNRIYDVTVSGTLTVVTVSGVCADITVTAI